MKLDALHTVDPAQVFLAVDAGDRDREFIKVGDLIQTWGREGLTVRAVRGDKMRALEGVFDEFAAAWQFPLYFGRNKDSFGDCLENLSPTPGKGFVVVVVNPEEVLADEPAHELEWLVRALKSAATEWGTPIELGEWWDRPAAPFHVILEVSGATGAHAIDRWSRVGAQLHNLPPD
jgi:hypothetical protein